MKASWERKRCPWEGKLGWGLQKHSPSLFQWVHLNWAQQELASVPAAGDAPKAVTKSLEGSFCQRVPYSRKVLLAESPGPASGGCCCCWPESCPRLGGRGCVGSGEEKRARVREPDSTQDEWDGKTHRAADTGRSHTFFFFFSFFFRFRSGSSSFFFFFFLWSESDGVSVGEMRSLLPVELKILHCRKSED